MSNAYFQFKHFTVNQDRCAMKVGTDGVLLGAWFGLEPGQSVLDIGTGTGLIALMAAQRGAGRVVAVEIESDAAAQAMENAQSSAWPVTVLNADIKDYAPGFLFDRIVCNPPYFRDSLRCPDDVRNAARHNDRLSYEDLTGAVCRLLAPDGEFSVVLPAETDMIRIAQAAGLNVIRSTRVVTAPGRQPKRVLLTFSRQFRQPESSTLDMTGAEYIELVRDFYLKY